MNILSKQPNPSGAYPAIFTADALPPGCAIVPDELYDTFYAYNGFVTLTVEGDTVTAMEPNTEAWEAWKALPHPDPPPDEMTLVQLALAELAEAQAADQTHTELALAELAEMIVGGV